MYDDCLSGSWLSERLAVDASRIDRMRRGGELIAVRPAGASAWLYPAWQFDHGKPYPAVQRITAAAAEAGLDEARLYEVHDTPDGPRRKPDAPRRPPPE